MLELFIKVCKTNDVFHISAGKLYTTLYIKHKYIHTFYFTDNEKINNAMRILDSQIQNKSTRFL